MMTWGLALKPILRVKELGVGPASIPQKELIAQKLAAAIQTATSEWLWVIALVLWGKRFRQKTGWQKQQKFFIVICLSIKVGTAEEMFKLNQRQSEELADFDDPSPSPPSAQLLRILTKLPYSLVLMVYYLLMLVANETTLVPLWVSQKSEVFNYKAFKLFEQLF